MASKCDGMVLCWLVGMALALTSTVQANLITNGDMELGGSATTPPMGWDYLDGPTVGVLGVSSDTPSGMGQSLSVMNNTSNNSKGAAYQTIAISGAGSYQLSFSYKGASPRWLVMTYPNYGNVGADNLSASVDHWTTYSTTITVPSTLDPSIFLALYAVTPGSTVLFDNVAITPEPATMALLGFGGLMVARRRSQAKL